MSKGALILFTRIAVPGRVKTRLMPLLSGAECAALQKAMTLDTAYALATLDRELFIFYSDEGPVELLDELPEKARLCPQKGTGLGARMYNALDTVLTLGYKDCLLLGSDLPLLDPGDVAKAGRILEEKDIVFCPSSDGGYWLVGMHTPFRPVFQGQRYSTGSVLADALASCAAHGLRPGLGPVRRDLDTPEDLTWLLAVKAAHPQLRGRVMDWLQTWQGSRG